MGQAQILPRVDPQGPTLASHIKPEAGSGRTLVSVLPLSPQC